MKQPPKIPLVSDIKAGRFLLRDRRRMSKRDREAVSNAYTDYLQPKLDEVRPGVKWCGGVRTEWDKYAERMFKSGMSPQDFQAKHPFEVEDDSNLNPELAILTFGVYTLTRDGDHRVRGLFCLYNIMEEGRSRGVIEISAFPCPAFKTGRGINPQGDQAIIMEALLEKNFKFHRKERELDLVEWRFPTSPGRQWLDDDGELYPPVKHLTNRSHPVKRKSVRGRDVPRSVRRAGK